MPKQCGIGAAPAEPSEHKSGLSLHKNRANRNKSQASLQSRVLRSVIIDWPLGPKDETCI
ncbi:hypothetical protein CHELA20_52886 [Hyphomicrobiales bacterium]|nr:hypothetical protein CHELA41_22040 [Hyphomicrobiales bacterium]CAH1683146.1 hypothetical protein CHELA20_52886 [Hyphomicrobiales bacterium]